MTTIDQPDETSQPEVGPSSLRGVLELVGPRLRRTREQVGMTVSVAAKRAGLPEALLSRVEAGEQYPDLELLLPLARTYRVRVDDVLAPPMTDDPRIRLAPRQIDGRTALPLTRPEGLQVWKIVVPPEQSIPRPVTHRGVEWLYVLNGQVRLVVGRRDLVLREGEAAEVDPQLPHWYGSGGDEAAEVLSIFGRGGQTNLLPAHHAAHAERYPHPHSE